MLHRDHGSAWRRRQRRQRSWWRHEQPSLATALAASAHHSFDKVAAEVKHCRHKRRTRQRLRTTLHGDGGSSQRAGALLQLYKEEPSGRRPAPLLEVAGPQDRVRRHFVEQIIESFVPVQILNGLVSPVVLGGMQDRILQRLVEQTLVEETEQVIEVPKISFQSRIPRRAVLAATQRRNEWVEVPIVVPWQHFVEQNVDIPVPGARGLLDGGGLQGLPSGQRSTALRGADLAGLQDFSPGQRSTVLHRADFDCFQDFSTGQGPTALRGADALGLQNLVPGQGLEQMLVLGNKTLSQDNVFTSASWSSFWCSSSKPCPKTRFGSSSWNSCRCWSSEPCPRAGFNSTSWSRSSRVPSRTDFIVVALWR